MDECAFQRGEALRLAAEDGVTFAMEDFSPAARARYRGQADVVTTLFNAFGYSLRRADDQERLCAMADLVAPGGVLVLDIRAERYQAEHFSTLDVQEEQLTPTATLTTRTYWHDGVLAAEEELVRRSRRRPTTVHRMTYGWNTYADSDLRALLARAGLTVVDGREDYYSNPARQGERLILVAEKR
jgi:hypothetical protein